MSLKDLKSELLSQYEYQIEMHAHTSPASGCSQVPPKEMAETYKNLGYDAVVITNHFLYQHDNCSKEDFLNGDIFLNADDMKA